jgi:hypothetical protein
MSVRREYQSGQLIPFYSYDGSYLDHITIKRAERLEQTGRVKVVRHKKGAVNRAILLRGSGLVRLAAGRGLQIRVPERSRDFWSRQSDVHRR